MRTSASSLIFTLFSAAAILSLFHVAFLTTIVLNFFWVAEVFEDFTNLLLPDLVCGWVLDEDPFVACWAFECEVDRLCW